MRSRIFGKEKGRMEISNEIVDAYHPYKHYDKSLARDPAAKKNQPVTKGS